LRDLRKPRRAPLSAVLLVRGSSQIRLVRWLRHRGSVPFLSKKTTGWLVAGKQRVADDRLGTLLDGLRSSMVVEVGRGKARIDRVDPRPREGGGYRMVSVLRAALDEA